MIDREEAKKYFYRFGLVFAVVLPILLAATGAQAFRIILYKLCLVTLAVGLAELIWLVFFKLPYGSTEAASPYENRSFLMFRGILCAAIVLALTLGL